MPMPMHTQISRPRVGGSIYHSTCATACLIPAPLTPGAAPPNFLWGEVSFGDNIQDEWFIVSLLLHATAQLPDLCARCAPCYIPPVRPEPHAAVPPPLVAAALTPRHRRVWDNDGEFLLIEAAYCLPKWVKPEVAENRVRRAAAASTKLN